MVNIYGIEMGFVTYLKLLELIFEIEFYIWKYMIDDLLIILMEYEHFALLSVDKNLLENDEIISLISSSCREIAGDLDLTFTSGNPLFGHVHRLSTGSFPVVWWNTFDMYILEFYRKTQIEVIILYVCEFNGETLEKHVYHHGIRAEGYQLIQWTPTPNDPEISVIMTIESLRINGNITSFCNPHY